MQLYYPISFSGRYSHGKLVFWAVPEELYRQKYRGGSAWLGSDYVTSIDELRREVESRGDILVIPWREDVRQAVKTPQGRVGFTQRPYNDRTAFVGPDAPDFDLIIPDRAHALKEGCIYRIGGTVRRVVRPGRRSLRFVTVTHHERCCSQPSAQSSGEGAHESPTGTL